MTPAWADAPEPGCAQNYKYEIRNICRRLVTYSFDGGNPKGGAGGAVDDLFQF